MDAAQATSLADHVAEIKKLIDSGEAEFGKLFPDWVNHIVAAASKLTIEAKDIPAIEAEAKAVIQEVVAYALNKLSVTGIIASTIDSTLTAFAMHLLDAELQKLATAL